ncbi:hypothetical protein [Mucilaginibacter lappiensis]|uniref:hypothetical protein n=1 Tax=Mucilaginibacter lappiensis TaxID=354630 RepID=UPI003D1A22C7
MKKILFLLLFIVLSKLSFSQTVYTLSEVTYRKVKNDGSTTQEPFQAIKKGSVARLYGNGLTMEFQNVMYDFVRKIIIRADDGDHIKYIATNGGNDVFEVMINDYGTYSVISILNRKTKSLELYKTL